MMIHSTRESTIMEPGDVLRWVKIRDVMDRLHISRQYVMQLMDAGRLRGVKTPLGWLVDPASVEAFEAGRKARQRPPNLPD